MTILAGIVSRSGSATIPDGICADLARIISRSDVDKVYESRGPSWYMAKIDIGVYGVPAICESKSSISILAGDPLLMGTNDIAPHCRSHDLEIIDNDLSTNNTAALIDATGTFCGAHYDKTVGRITLFTDKVGLRPIYYWFNDDYIVFGSALRILEGISLVPKLFDIKGVAEIASFGFPLANRTPYDNIFTLRAAELVQVCGAAISHRYYWRWDTITEPQLNGVSIEEEAGKRFLSAVKRRLNGHSSTAAFLSGGLDSRTIVAALRALGTTVHTINFSPEHTQDEVFGRTVASLLQTSHHHLIKQPESVVRKDQVYNQDEVNRWFDAQTKTNPASGLRRIMWSGDGGSVAVGHVYLTDRIIGLAHKGETEKAITEFLFHNKIRAAKSVFKSSIRTKMTSIPETGVGDELSLLECKDLGRAFHLFLMLNDQRRHLAGFYENIDLGRLEFHLPFFDSHFLALILSSPITPFLRHQFYLSWLNVAFPKAVSVPWQAYPGHVPCPLPAPANLRYQWGTYYNRATEDHMRRDTLAKAARLFESTNFPKGIIDRKRLRLATWLTQLRVGNYSYMIDSADTFARYWDVCVQAKSYAPAAVAS